MLTETRQAFNLYMDRIGELNGVDARRDAKFTVDPSVQQTLETRIQESSAFLQAINIIGVPELQGEKLGLGVTSTIAGRTDTSGNGRRVPRDPTGLSSTGFQLTQTNFDVALRYAKLDMWAKFPDFQARWSGAVIERCALDRIMIGFNGTSAAATTDRGANPLLQDVNIGWLQDMRTNNDERVMEEGVTGSGQITVGLGGDYANLDALVMDALHEMMPSWARDRTDIVAICGADLLHDKYFEKVDKIEKPTEELALQTILASKRLGGKQAQIVPFFPNGSIFLTPLSNLSLYFQDGKRRRHIREEPDADRVADYNSSNEGYVIEDYEHAVLLENITLLDADGE
jgi:P2 family phage major capsid protein